MSSISPKLHTSYLQALQKEFEAPYFSAIKQYLLKEKADGKRIYPPGSLIFNALNTTPLDKVKAVILGQDPYHGPGQAHGLCFSVPKGIKPPPSLVNIYKELKDDMGMEIPGHGELTAWAERGVLLLNAFLTVRAGEPASHSKIGWEQFTNAIIKTVSDNQQGVVFILWGRFAQEKAALIDESKHPVLMAAHPSPFSANNGFFGCKHFSKTNMLLKQMGKDEIDWRID